MEPSSEDWGRSNLMAEREKESYDRGYREGMREGVRGALAFVKSSSPELLERNLESLLAGLAR